MDVVPQLPGLSDLTLAYRGVQNLVWRAVADDGARVVVKTSRPEVDTRRIRSEATLLSALRGPGLPVLRTVLETPEGPALVMLDAGPENLESWLGSRRLTVGTCLDLAIELTEIVASVHRAGVIHRDVNPSNVVVDGAGSLTLVDFGLAVPAQSVPPGGTSSGRLSGTVAYLAPEQTGRTNRALDRRADLYSLGATLHRLIAGTPPFPGTDSASILHGHLARTPPRLERLRPDVPAALADIVLRLLEKMPEARYQSAESLREDLEEARRQWLAAGRIVPFPLGRGDLRTTLELPARRYGGEDALAELSRALVEATAGQRVAVAVTGPAGIGKTTLVRALQPLVEERGARMLTGKFEPARTVPHAALREAFRTLATSTPEAERAGLRERLLGALGENAGLMTELVPELEVLLGPQELPPGLPPHETSNRFTLTLSRFVAALATRGTPLVLVFEDVHWADPASLTAFEALAADDTLQALLLVCTWRTEREASSLVQRFWSLATRGQTVHRISVEPMDESAVARLLGDAMGLDPEATVPLAALVARKTAGSPLFVHRLVRRLAQDGLIRRQGAGWIWDLAAVERLPVSENVVALMEAELEALPPATGAVVNAAACLGARSPVAVLARALELAPDDLRRRAQPAISAGLFVWEAEEDAVAFAHDRIQQAAYERVPRLAAATTHARIGTLLSNEPTMLFAAADQLHLATQLVADSVEPELMARVSLAAGTRAMASSAFQAASIYLDRAVTALGPEGWTAREQMLALHRDAAASAWSAGNPELALARLARALEHTENPVERAGLIRVQVMAACVRGDWQPAIEAAASVLAELGHGLPESDRAAAYGAELEHIHRLMAGRPPRALLDLPPVEDATARAAQELLSDLAPAFFFGTPELLPWACARLARLAIEAGAGPGSAYALALHGMMLAAATGDLPAGCAYGQVAVEMAQRQSDPVQRCRTLHVVANHVQHWGAPLRSTERLFREAFAAGAEGGDLEFAAFASNALAVHQFHGGVTLRAVLRELSAGLAFARRGGHRAMIDICLALQQAVAALRPTGRPAEPFDHEEWRQAMARNPPAQGMEAVFLLQVAYLRGDLAEAQRQVEAATARRALLAGLFTQAELPYYAGLTCASLGDAAGLDTHLATLQGLAETCPSNFQHKAALLGAERDRLAGRILEAMAGYDAAIAGAAREGFLQDEGLANRQAALLYHGLGRTRVAALYARSAAEAWHRWGATALLPGLEAAIPELVVEGARAAEARPGSDATQPDLAAVLEAAEAITAEVDLERLLHKLMAVCVEAAGATRGVLVVEEAAGPFVRAVRDPGDHAGNLVCREPLASSGRLPVALVQRVMEEGEPLVVDDVLQDIRLTLDAYIATHAPRSLLVLPVNRQAQRIAVLYFENLLASHAFTPQRTRLLRLLSTEIAISLHNSLLFAELAQENERRQRTAVDLARSNEELETFVYSLSHDLKRLARTATSCLDIVLEDHGVRLGADAKDLTMRARRAMQEVTPLLESLLRYSRAGQQIVDRVEVNLGEMAGRSLARLRKRNAARRIEVRIGPDLRARGDEALVRLLLEALLENAWVFTAGCPSPRIEVGRRGDLFYVRDNGVGFDPRFAEKLFKPFQRIHDPGQFRGVGLGLATARRIAERHGGTIGATCVPGQLTEFWFRLEPEVPPG